MKPELARMGRITGAPPMKTVEYRGKMYRVPDWARFIATDEDGNVCAYELKPSVDGLQWWRQPGSKADSQAFVSVEDWRDSLVELPE